MVSISDNLLVFVFTSDKKMYSIEQIYSVIFCKSSKQHLMPHKLWVTPRYTKNYMLYKGVVKWL